MKSGANFDLLNQSGKMTTKDGNLTTTWNKLEEREDLGSTIEGNQTLKKPIGGRVFDLPSQSMIEREHSPGSPDPIKDYIQYVS